jgi:hypothetical protein
MLDRLSFSMDINAIQNIAQSLVKYYERLAAENAQQWEFAADTAKRWLQLMTQETVNLVEVNELVAVLNSRDEGSAWLEMRIFTKAWRHQLLDK